MGTAQVTGREEIKALERPETDNCRKETRDDRKERVVGIVMLSLMLVVFVLAIVLGSIYGEPTELDHIDYWMMP